MERWKINLYTLWVSQTVLMSFGFGIPFVPFYFQNWRYEQRTAHYYVVCRPPCGSSHGTLPRYGE